MAFSLETHGACHLARELAKFDKWESTFWPRMEAAKANEAARLLLDEEQFRLKRLRLAWWMDTRDRNRRETLLTCSLGVTACRRLVQDRPPRIA